MLDSVLISFVFRLFKRIKYSYDRSLLSLFIHNLGLLFINSLICEKLSSEWKLEKSLMHSRFYSIVYKPIQIIGIKSRNKTSKFIQFTDSSIFYKLLKTDVVYYLICLIVFGIPFFPTMILIALTALAFLLVVFRLLLGMETIHKPNAIDFALIIFMGCLVFSTVTSYEIKKAIQVLLVYLVFILFYVVIVTTVKTKKQLILLLNVFLISGLVTALYGLYQYKIGVAVDRAWIDSDSFEQVKTRVYSTFGNPNVLGEYLTILSIISIGFLWSAKKKTFRFIYFISTLLIVLCMLLTYSRGSWVGLMLACFVFALFVDRRLLILGLIAVALMPFILPESILVRFQSIANVSGDSSFMYRVSIWQGCLNMLKSFWPTGIGLASFDNVYPLYSFEAATVAYHSHNTLLQIWIELGIVGITSFIGMLIFFFQKLLSRFRISKDRTIKIFIGCIFGGMLGLLLQAMTDNIWFNYSILLFFFIVIALGGCLIEIAKTNVGERK